MMKANGEIICHRTNSNLDGDIESMSYEWNGGPFRLIVLKGLDWDEMYFCTRVDNWGWRIFYFLYGFLRELRFVYYRIILTLCVWDLAERKVGEIPSIRHIYAVRRFSNFLKTLKARRSYVPREQQVFPGDYHNAGERLDAEVARLHK